MTLALIIAVLVASVVAATVAAALTRRQHRRPAPPPMRIYLDEVAPLERRRARGYGSPHRTSPGHAAPFVGDGGACDSGAGSSGGDGGGGGC